MKQTCRRATGADLPKALKFFAIGAKTLAFSLRFRATDDAKWAQRTPLGAFADKNVEEVLTKCGFWTVVKRFGRAYFVSLLL
jgi:hypothetical protein